MDDGDIFEHVMVSPVGAGVQRLDVIASGVGRRRWTREAKARIIGESMVPGANVAEVARRNDMQPQHLYLWRRTALDHMGSRMAEERQDYPEFVPARVEVVPMIATPAAPAISDAPDLRSVGDVCSAQISVELAGMTVRIPERASAEHIAHVLRAVRGAS
jgi:transposase